METLAELKAMDGTQGSEILYLATLENTYYRTWEVEDIRTSLVDHPKMLKKFNNSLVKTINTWIWEFKIDRFGNPICYRINEKYTQVLD